MALTPIDMKGMIPRTQEISDMENNKSLREREIQVGNQREQEKQTEKDLSQIKESEKTQGEGIKREKESENGARREGQKAKSDKKDQEEEDSKVDSLNVSVDSKRIKVGKKIDIKV